MNLSSIKNTLQFDQLEEYRIPFNIYDILPGFKSTFIDTRFDYHK